MSIVYVATVICDEPGCMTRAETRGGLGAVKPSGWRHVPGRSSREWGVGWPPRDYCPEHAPRTDPNGDPQ